MKKACSGYSLQMILILNSFFKIGFVNIDAIILLSERSLCIGISATSRTRGCNISHSQGLESHDLNVDRKVSNPNNNKHGGGEMKPRIGLEKMGFFLTYNLFLLSYIE